MVGGGETRFFTKQFYLPLRIRSMIDVDEGRFTGAHFIILGSLHEGACLGGDPWQKKTGPYSIAIGRVQMRRDSLTLSVRG